MKNRNWDMLDSLLAGEYEPTDQDVVKACEKRFPIPFDMTDRIISIHTNTNTVYKSIQHYQGKNYGEPGHDKIEDQIYFIIIDLLMLAHELGIKLDFSQSRKKAIKWFLQIDDTYLYYKVKAYNYNSEGYNRTGFVEVLFTSDGAKIMKFTVKKPEKISDTSPSPEIIELIKNSRRFRHLQPV